LLLLASRWLPGRRVIAVADTTYAVIELLAALRHRLTMVTRLRLDARLFDPPPPRRPGTRGRRRVTGQRQPVQRLADPANRWRRVTVSQWYGEGKRELDILTGTAVWPGRRVPVRWVLVRDVVGAKEPQAFLCPDLEADALDVLRWFVRRWAVDMCQPWSLSSVKRLNGEAAFWGVQFAQPLQPLQFGIVYGNQPCPVP
jgi:hypothetical protein